MYICGRSEIARVGRIAPMVTDGASGIEPRCLAVAGDLSLYGDEIRKCGGAD